MNRHARTTALATALASILLGFVALTWAQGYVVGTAQEAQKICGAGYFLLKLSDGSMNCLARLPPRSQADCPPKTTFDLVAGVGNVGSILIAPITFLRLHAGDPPPTACKTNSDCPNNYYCGSNHQCSPFRQSALRQLQRWHLGLA
jgi:hypothetical protein